MEWKVQAEREREKTSMVSRDARIRGHSVHVKKQTVQREGERAIMKGSSKKRGLNTELHSVLKSDNVNLLRIQARRGGNPYLDEQSGSKEHGSSELREARGLPRARISSHWYAPGEIVAQAEQLRSVERKRIAEEERAQQTARAEELERRRRVQEGEEPDDYERVYFTAVEDVPSIEWWDQPYYKNGELHQKYSLDYEKLGEDEDSDEEDPEDIEHDAFPSIRYIQHPVPIERARAAEAIPKVFLTKQEQKKARRNRRKIVRQEREEKIKLGMEPKPEPKVKLSNMMSVYENSANITDPTQWEAIVRKQVADRKRVHLEENQRRHEESVKRKKTEPLDKNAPKNNCCVYIFDEIKNPTIRYKININGKQLHLKGCCLHIQEQGGVIIAFGDEKSIRFFDKLVMKRLKWAEPYVDKSSGDTVSCNGKITKVWQGVIDDCPFSGWFMLNCKSAADLNGVLLQQDALAFVPSGLLFRHTPTK